MNTLSCNMERMFELLDSDGIVMSYDADTGKEYAMSVAFLEDTLRRVRERIGVPGAHEFRMSCWEVNKKAGEQCVEVVLQGSARLGEMMTRPELRMYFGPNEPDSKWLDLKDGSQFPGEKFFARKSFRVRVEPVLE